MSNLNGFGKDIAWEHENRQTHAAPPAGEAPPVSPSAADAAPAPPQTGAGTIETKGNNTENGIDPRYILGGVIVLSIVLIVGMLISWGRPQPAPDVVQVPPVQATTAPTPVSTPVPTATAGETAIALVDQLIAKRQYDTAAYMAEEALKTTHSDPERKALQERLLSAHLHALAAQDPAYIDVPVQQQQVKRYTYLKDKARTAGIPFLSTLEVAQLAAANKHWRWAKFAYEESYNEGAWSQADDLIMRQYEEAIFRQGWWQANYGTGSTKTEGLRLLALRYAFDTARGRAKDQALTELLKDCDPEKRTCPPPAETPLLPTTQKGGS